MSAVLFLVSIALVALIAAGWWKYSALFPKTSQEIVRLDADKRRVLIGLRDERKFEPIDYLRGYTGVASPEEGVVARAAVNEAIDAILAREDGSISSATVSELISRGMKRVSRLETEDRDRTAGYMVEIWYLLGFKGSTGLFAYGAAVPRPDGYGEPLPPGWKSPTQPRRIGEP